MALRHSERLLEYVLVRRAMSVTRRSEGRKNDNCIAQLVSRLIQSQSWLMTSFEALRLRASSAASNGEQQKRRQWLLPAFGSEFCYITTVVQSHIVDCEGSWRVEGSRGYVWLSQSVAGEEVFAAFGQKGMSGTSSLRSSGYRAREYRLAQGFLGYGPLWCNNYWRDKFLRNARS